MPEYIKSIYAIGVHGRFDLNQQLKEGVNIIHGKNGAGKTTFLHILANILNADYKRFVYLKFNTIEVEFNDGAKVTLKRIRLDNEEIIDVYINDDAICSYPVKPASNDRRRMGTQQSLFDDAEFVISKNETLLNPLLPAAYFPAFRTMIEAWGSVQEERDVTRNRAIINERAKATRFARDLFGRFVPEISYPSPIEIEQRLGSEIQQAIFTVARTDQELLSEAFLAIFASLSSDTNQIIEQPEAILEQIRSLYESLEESSFQANVFGTGEGVYVKLRQLVNTFRIQEQSEGIALRILDVYRNSLYHRAQVQKESFEAINRYLNSVNEFLEGKKINNNIRRDPKARSFIIDIEFDDSTSSRLRSLSSGERQIVTLIYAATHMSDQKIVLIDEPELSLHVDWQRKLISRMSAQLESRQIIACTHSPVIAANYDDRMIELVLTPTVIPNPTSDEGIGEDS